MERQEALEKLKDVSFRIAGLKNSIRDAATKKDVEWDEVLKLQKEVDAVTGEGELNFPIAFLSDDRTFAVEIFKPGETRVITFVNV